ARLRLRSPDGAELPAVAMVHLEVESREAVRMFRRRMYDYYQTLRRKHDCPVLPIAVYLRVGLDGVGVEEYVEEYGGLVLRYLYGGLPALGAEQYVAGASWLGVALAALMRMPRERKPWLRAEAFRRLLEESSENAYRRYLLCECIDAYLGLDAEGEREYQRL